MPGAFTYVALALGQTFEHPRSHTRSAVILLTELTGARKHRRLVSKATRRFNAYSPWGAGRLSR